MGSIAFSGAGNATPGKPPSAAVRAKVTVKKSVRGASFATVVKVPGRGRIVISGVKVGAVKRVVSKAGSYTLKVKLTKRARAQVKKAGRLKVQFRVVFMPAAGKPQASTMSITVKA